MSMFGKHTWVSKLLGCWLVLCSFLPAAAEETVTSPKDVQNLVCHIVRQHGKAFGGAESIGSLIELNMRQWKPQSSRGIEIYGWRAEKIGAAAYRVTYEYQEMGCDSKILSWRVDLVDSKIVPLTPLSARILEMSQIL
jgi:hypothetical protein